MFNKETLAGIFMDKWWSSRSDAMLPSWSLPARLWHMPLHWLTRQQNLQSRETTDGFIDLITLIFASVLVLVVLIPFVIGTVRIVVLKQQLDQRAWNLLRAATTQGLSPPSTLRIDGQSVSVALQGSLSGCSVNRLTLSTNTTLPGLALLGRSISSYQVTGSATIAIGGYRNPDSEGINCAVTIQGN